MKFFSLFAAIVLLVSVTVALPRPVDIPGTQNDKREKFSDSIKAVMEAVEGNNNGLLEELASSFLGDLAILGYLAIGKVSKQTEQFMFDLIAGQKASSAPSQNSNDAFSFISYTKAPNATAGQYVCLNKHLSNPNSGICGFTGCSYGASRNCTSEYYDCCIAMATDYNGRSECSQAICRKRAVLAAPYVDGGCCRGGSAEID